MESGGFLCLWTLAGWLAGWFVLGRIQLCGRRTAPAVPADKLSIIIPARNEELNLPKLLGSLDAQSVHPQEIIVVDDGSTDRTAERARRPGVQVVAARPLPDGWRGKTWACQQGAQLARGEFFLFLDADTWFEPDGLARALAEFPAPAHGALSVAPHHCVRDFSEQFSAFFNLIMLAGTGAFTAFGDHFKPRGLLGQFLLIDRASYEKVGRHEIVKGRILENLWLAQALRAAGVPLRCRSGRGVFSFRMYPDGWRPLIEGWTKGFASGAGRTPWPILLPIILWLGTLLFAPIGIFTQGAPLRWLTIYALCVAQVGWLLRRAGTFAWPVAVFYPVLVLFFCAVFGRSLLRSGKNVTWKGRDIRAD